MADKEKELILIERNGKFEDSTYRIASIRDEGTLFKIKYSQGSNQEYTYSQERVIHLKNPESLDPRLYRLYSEGRELYGISRLLKYTDDRKGICYLGVFFANGYFRSYDLKSLRIEVSSFSDKNFTDCFSYLREIAEANGLRSKDSEKALLSEQYKKIDYIGSQSILSYYLNPEKAILKKHRQELMIFPFGGNRSQFKAVSNALNNQLSVIQGPPGTGKTQTILNIVANLLYRNKTILIVSNNNSAIQNVQEKLAKPDIGLDFLSAMLGNSDNKRNFILSQIGTYPDMDGWELDDKEKELDEIEVQKLQQEMDDYFSALEKAAELRKQTEALKTEEMNFGIICEDSGLTARLIPELANLSIGSLTILWTKVSNMEESRSRLLLFRLACTFRYALPFRLFRNLDTRTISILLQKAIYSVRIRKLSEELSEMEKAIKDSDKEAMLCRLENLSQKLLHNRIQHRYGKKSQRSVFDDDSLWKHGKDIQKEYPIILSTAFSSLASLPHAKYDYLIMDEASQVDIPTGALSLAVADNAVIIGDEMQLPNIITEKDRSQFDAIFHRYQINERYRCREDNTFLNSIKSVTPADCSVLLKEHYRCNPKIIGFCNQKFYNNELIVMTNDNNGIQPLSVLKTVKGCHARSDRTNHREAEEIRKEILPELEKENISDIGIISPFRNQTTLLCNEINDKSIEISTVHKFQGREKDAIIFSVAEDEISSFADNPHLLNVAVSRAKKKFILVVSGNSQKQNGNITDLISYITYAEGIIEDGNLYSVFDLLYTENEELRIKLLRKYGKISDFDSENLVYSILHEIVSSKYNGQLGIAWHYPLCDLIRHPDKEHLGEEKYRFATSSLSHLDFLIYRSIGKNPLLAIEVDGYTYHDRNSIQMHRDKLKDEILMQYSIPILRLNTTDSDERNRIKMKLEELF